MNEENGIKLKLEAPKDLNGLFDEFIKFVINKMPEVFTKKQIMEHLLSCNVYVCKQLFISCYLANEGIADVKAEEENKKKYIDSVFDLLKSEVYKKLINKKEG